MKLSFDSEDGAPTDAGRDLANLAEKLRQRFRVCAAACPSHGGTHSQAIAIAALASSEDKLTQLLDAIVGFCDAFGLGRVSSEETLFDHVDEIGEYQEQ